MHGILSPKMNGDWAGGSSRRSTAEPGRFGDGSVSGGRFDGESVAERFELSDVIALPGRGIDLAVVVVGTEILPVGFGIGQDVSNHHQQ